MLGILCIHKEAENYAVSCYQSTSSLDKAIAERSVCSGLVNVMEVQAILSLTHCEPPFRGLLGRLLFLLNFC